MKVAEGVALWGQIGWESSEQIGWFPRAIIAQCKPRSSWDYNLHINGNFDRHGKQIVLLKTRLSEHHYVIKQIESVVNGLYF